MTAIASPVIELTEYETRYLPAARLPEAVGRRLLDRYAAQVAVEFPNPKTEQQWQLAAKGWVGHLPLTPDLGLVINPKLPLQNLFRMWAYAYGFDRFQLPEGLAECRSLNEFYEQVALILARRILKRVRQGLYRAYLPQAEALPYLRGRLDTAEALRTPGRATLPCRYQEQTADLEDNRILAWTLYCLSRMPLSESARPVIRRAYRALQGACRLEPYSAAACLNRRYHRLNQDYQPLHALCRFFLAQSGPSHRLGQQSMLPFLVDMAHLYELFVARWLEQHLPPEAQLTLQERVTISHSANLNFEIDLVLYDRRSGAPQAVLDTKYKTQRTNDDIFQAVTYAQAKGCREALLVYPAPLSQPFDVFIGETRVRSLVFSLAGNLEQAGRDFLQGLEGSG